jgi:hypothetical protein
MVPKTMFLTSFWRGFGPYIEGFRRGVKTAKTDPFRGGSCPSKRLFQFEKSKSGSTTAQGASKSGLPGRLRRSRFISKLRILTIPYASPDAPRTSIGRFIASKDWYHRVDRGYNGPIRGYRDILGFIRYIYT